MKRVAQIICMLGIAASCTTKTQESANPPNEDQVHFVSNDEISPITLINYKGEHWLFYSSPDSWNYIASSDLINWSEPKRIDISSDSNGEVIVDQDNTSGLKSSVSDPFLAYYFDDEVRLKYSVDEGESWENAEISVPSSIEGENPKTSRDPLNGEWIMSLTNEGTTSILKSQNLLTWELISELTLEAPIITTKLVNFDGTWLALASSDQVTKYLRLDREFNVIGKPKRIIYSPKKTFNVISEVNNQKLILSNIGGSTLSLPAEVLPINDSLVKIERIAEQDRLSATKKRSKLSSLRGQGPSRYQFQVDSYEKAIELKITNEQGEYLLLSFNSNSEKIIVDQSNASSAFDGEITEFDWEPSFSNFSADIIIDYNTIECLVNDGEVILNLPVNPVFIYDRLDLKVDSADYDARGILFTLNKDQYL